MNYRVFSLNEHWKNFKLIYIFQIHKQILQKYNRKNNKNNFTEMHADISILTYSLILNNLKKSNVLMQHKSMYIRYTTSHGTYSYLLSLGCQIYLVSSPIPVKDSSGGFPLPKLCSLVFRSDLYITFASY